MVALGRWAGDPERTATERTTYVTEIGDSESASGRDALSVHAMSVRLPKESDRDSPRGRVNPSRAHPRRCLRFSRDGAGPWRSQKEREVLRSRMVRRANDHLRRVADTACVISVLGDTWRGAYQEVAKELGIDGLIEREEV